MLSQVFKNYENNGKPKVSESTAVIISIIKLHLRQGNLYGRREAEVPPWTGARAKAREEIVRYLLKSGLDVNAKNEKGATTLHYAALSAKEAQGLLQALLDAGADPLLLDNSGHRVANMIRPHSRIPEMPIWSRLSPDA